MPLGLLRLWESEASAFNAPCGLPQGSLLYDEHAVTERVKPKLLVNGDIVEF